jgi:Ni/Co efflux regulator RcnB
MKKLLASLAAVSLLASPAFAQTNTSTTAKTTKTTKATHASSKIAKDAKAEHESVATEKKEVKAAAKHHYGKYSRCGTSHMKSHKMAHHATHKAAAKATKSTTKTSG